VTIVFIAKYLFTGSVNILNKIVFKIAIKFISMRNPEISSLAEDEGELLFLFDTSSRKVFREENHPFRRNAWTLMKFIPGVHTTWHMCVFHDKYTLTNDVLHITLCVDIISFPLEFSFEFI
jgi:hypothetical protein